VRVLLISTYELGHQPWHLASPAAALDAAGHSVRTLDLAVEGWDDERVAWAEGIAFSVPMHTAMRLARRAAERSHLLNPDASVCFYGLYASMAGGNEPAFAGEYEPALAAWAAGHPPPSGVDLYRHAFVLPSRATLPSLDNYAHLVTGEAERIVGYVEASHGCAHRCRHCPVPAIYNGRVRPVTEEAVLADVAQQVAAGATHITFGDPDFLNAVPHSKRIVRALHEAFPDVTFDCTVKVEHILRYARLWGEWAAAGCVFVVSAVECVNDDILRRLDKGHTATDAADAVALLRSHGVDLRPSFLPFTPWTTAADLLAIMHFVIDNDLIGNVDPVQYTIRLLLPEGSLLLDDPDLGVGPYDEEHLTYTWSSALDGLHVELTRLVEGGIRRGDSVAATFMDVNAAIHRGAGVTPPALIIPSGSIEGRPRLTEPWFC
jgi:radical SAM superfamily enzyme YgiQ (UPF0313 family)